MTSPYSHSKISWQLQERPGLEARCPSCSQFPLQGPLRSRRQPPPRPALIPVLAFPGHSTVFHTSTALSTLARKLCSSCKDPALVSPPRSLSSNLQGWPCLLWGPQLPQPHRTALPRPLLPWHHPEERLSRHSTGRGDRLLNEWGSGKRKQREEMVLWVVPGNGPAHQPAQTTAQTAVTLGAGPARIEPPTPGCKGKPIEACGFRVWTGHCQQVMSRQSPGGLTLSGTLSGVKWTVPLPTPSQQ